MKLQIEIFNAYVDSNTILYVYMNIIQAIENLLALAFIEVEVD